MHKLNAGMTECSTTRRYTGQPSAATLKSKHNRRLCWSTRMPKLPGAAPGQQLQSRGGEHCSSLSVYEPSSYQAVLVRATVHSQPAIYRLRPSPQPAASPQTTLQSTDYAPVTHDRLIGPQRFAPTAEHHSPVTSECNDQIVLRPRSCRLFRPVWLRI